ncbi:hypothetical protein HDU97_008846 [Phlyctochytrium planicorne]|nr:hypothetical protein HDU97_008846 [Phlyctochytrium planicorne]
MECVGLAVKEEWELAGGTVRVWENEEDVILGSMMTDEEGWRNHDDALFLPASATSSKLIPPLLLAAIQEFFSIEDPWSFVHPPGTHVHAVATHITYETTVRSREILCAKAAERVNAVSLAMTKAKWTASRVLVRMGVVFEVSEEEAAEFAMLRSDGGRDCLKHEENNVLGVHLFELSGDPIHPAVQQIAKVAVTVSALGISESDLIVEARKGNLVTLAMTLFSSFLACEDFKSLRFPLALSRHERNVLIWASEKQGIFHRVIAVASTTGILGVNTSNGDAFDQPFLRDTVYAFLLGFTFSLFANVFIWPEYAERYLVEELVSGLETVKFVVSSLVRTFSQESGAEEGESRTQAIAHLQDIVKRLWELYSQVESEPRVSRLSAADYKQYISAMSELVLQVSSIHKAVKGLEHSLFCSPQYKDNVALPFKNQFQDIEGGCAALISRIQSGMKEQGSWRGLLKKDEESARAISSNLHTSILQSLAEVESSQMSALLEMLESGISPEITPSSRKSSARKQTSHETVLQVNFFILCLRQFTFDLEHLMSDVETERELRFRFCWKKYLPKLQILLGAADEDDSDIHKKPVVARKGRLAEVVKKFLARCTGLLLRKESVYGFKCGCAVLIYMMVLFNQRDWYKNWYLQASFVAFCVVLTPSRGQSTLSFIINLLGAIVGYSFGYLTLSAWGTGVVKLTGYCSGWFGCTEDRNRYLWGIWGFATFFAIPMVHIQLHTKLSVLGLLSLLSFSTSIVGSFSNRQNPFYDDPYHRYYKLIASACMAITFAYIFCLFIYPNSVRRRLRQSLSTILRRLNALYAQILSNSYAPVDARSSLVNDHTRALTRMKDIHLDLYKTIGEVEAMMVFAAVEFKIRGPFPRKTYEEIIEVVKSIHERLGSAMAIVGDKPFDPYVRGLLANSLKKSKKDLQTVVRLILYLQSSALISRQPLPVDIPSAQRTRALIFSSVWAEMMEAFRASPPDENISESSLSPKAPVRTSSLVPPSRPLSMSAVNSSIGSVEDDWEGSTLLERLEGSVGMLPTDRKTLRNVMRGESWIRFYSFSVAMKMLSQEVDSLTPLLKHLFGELSGFISPTTGAAASFAKVPSFDPLSLPTLTNIHAIPVHGHRGHDEEEEIYGIEDREATENIEGIPSLRDENLIGAVSESVSILVTDGSP